jgi:O-antigen ligase
MKVWSAALLYAMLTASILTSWIPARWPTSILEVGSFLLALVWMVKFAITGERPRFAAVLAPVAFIVTWGSLQLAFHWTVASSETVRATLGWASNLAILFIGLQIFDPPTLRKRFLRGLLWFAFLVCIVAIVQRFTSTGKQSFTMGPFVYHNYFAVFVEALLPLAILAAIRETEKRIWFSFVSATMIAAVILSASRSGAALVFLETALILVLTRKPLAILLITTAAFTAIIGWDALATRLQERRAYYDRLQMLHSSLDMFRDHPLTGAGLDNWPIVFPYYARYDDGLFANQAHNDWAQIAAEAGIPGFVAFAIFFALTLREARRNPWCIGLVFVFLHALIDYPFHKPQIAAMLCALLALANAAKQRVMRTPVLFER